MFSRQVNKSRAPIGAPHTRSRLGALTFATQRLGRQALDAIAPQRCALCDMPSHDDLALCSVCRGELVRNDPACRQCALPLLSGSYCPACLKTPPPLSQTIAPFIYDDALAYLIGRWKYHGDEALSATFAGLWLDALRTVPEPDLLLPVPLHWRRQFRRGYNQAQLLMSALSAREPALVPRRNASARLRRTRPTLAQAHANRKERLANLRNAFALRGDVSGLSIALIDDVCTTGTTAFAAAQTLRDAGAGDVQLWCIARTASP